MKITGILLTSFLFFGASILQAQEKNTLRLNHIAVYVENLQKSTAFYKNVLQLTEIPEPFHDGLHTWFTLGQAGSLHLIQGAKGGVEREKNDHLCFSTNDIDKFIHNLESHQISYFDWPGNKGKVTTRVDGIHQIYFQDPDGHWIEINDEQ
ncbi:VOC family protein [Olivibacter sp. SA151]|uniref:VOC family protein n=1 Tax=Olivibacter jilunii TaxID=985016 RepID=UPI003F18201A